MFYVRLQTMKMKVYSNGDDKQNQGHLDICGFLCVLKKQVSTSSDHNT
jgi:hypothetical protein